MRRGNKSHKVPNVRLRPAPLPARTPRDHPDASCDPSSDPELPPNSSMVDLCPRPFKRFTICATGTMDKSALFKLAFELGAASTLDFTDRVTHLIANTHGGAKYMCALERKIPIMIPDWITEAHAIWLRGDDVDVEQGITNHRLPIFSGVVLSLSGIDDIPRRTEINRLLTEHQGVYLKNLERPVRVTHLLCSGDIETDKMRYAEKFNKRKEAQIHLVWEEWFWDCLEFGGRFDEKKYQVSRPRPERKALYESPIPSLPVDESVPDSRQNLVPADDVNHPKLLKPPVPAGGFTVINNISVEGEEEEMAIINKPVPAMTLQLWQRLLKPRGFELDGGKLVRSPSKSQTTRSPPSTPTRPPALPSVAIRNGTLVEHGKGKEKDSIISSFRRANSFAPVPVKEPTIRQPFRRNTTCPLVCPAEKEGGRLLDPTQPEGESAAPSVFTGYNFRLLGEARCPNVRLAIENGGGVVTDDDAEEPNFIIVRLISGSKLYHDEFDDYARSKYRTECWLEHSVFHERICAPDENVSFTPLRITMPVTDAEKISLSLSGLDQSELCWIRRLVRAVGITLESTFSRRSTHLLCPSGGGVKFDKALEWGIPVVSLRWLEEIAKTGTIPRHPNPTLEVRRDKGKGKEKEVGHHPMMDSTDGHSANQPAFARNVALLKDTAPQEPDVRQHHDSILGPMSPARSGLFGKPRLLMHPSDPPGEIETHADNPAISSSPVPPPQSSSPIPVEDELLPELTPPIPALPAPVPFTPVRQPTQSNRDAIAKADVPAPAQMQARIPSSTSPSPMKLPPSSIPDAFATSSPDRLPDTEAIAKALHESLTSLLGKRPIAEDEVMREAAARKKGKRVRPGSTMPSRDVSRENVISPHRPVVPPPPVPLADIDMSLLDGLGMGAPGSTEESLRVTYEDPGQAEEKRRLLRILGEDVGEVGMRAGVIAGVAAKASNVSRPRRTKRTKVP